MYRNGQQARAENQIRRGIVRNEMLAMVRQLCNQVGYSLSQFVLKKYGGTTDMSRIGFARLTIVMERLTDLATEITRLSTAADVIGAARYASICKDLNLTSDSIGDIPNCAMLRVLVRRVESEAAAMQDSAVSTSSGALTIEDACDRLLQQAPDSRRVSPSDGV